MSNDQQENYDEAGYWDDNGEYQYYQQQQQEEGQWYGDGTSAPSSPTNTASPWELAYDDDNNPYYFNHTTSEWQYEVPSDYVDPYGGGFATGEGVYDDGTGGAYTDYADGSYANGGTVSPSGEELGYWDENGQFVYYESPDLNDMATTNLNEGTYDPSNFIDSQGWQAVDDGYGNLYYYNNYTEEQQWEVPETYTIELNSQDWYNQSVENAAVAFQGKDTKTAAIIRIQSMFRKIKAKRKVIRKRQMHKNIKDLHKNAVVKEKNTTDEEKIEENIKDNSAAIKIQSIVRKNIGKKISNDLKNVEPILKRIQGYVNGKKQLYGEEIVSEDDFFIKIDRDGDGIVNIKEICDAIQSLNIGFNEIQRNRLIRGAFHNCNHASIGLVAFKKSLRLGNVAFHKRSRRKRYEEGKVVKEEGSLVEAIQWSKEGIEMVAKQKEKEEKKNENLSSSLHGTSTMSISRVDFLTNHAIHSTDDASSSDQNKFDNNEFDDDEFDDNGYNEKGEHIDDVIDNNRNRSRSNSSSTISPKPISPKKHDIIIETTGMKHPDSLKRSGYLRIQEKKLLKQISLNPKSSDSWIQYGYVLLEQDKHDDALVKLQKGAELGGSTSRLWRSTGHCLYVLDQVDAARLMYSKAIKTHREEQKNSTEKVLPPMLMLYRAARMDMRRNSYDKAYQKLNNLTNTPNFDEFIQQQEVYISMGSCKYQMNDYETALDWFQTVIQPRPKKIDKEGHSIGVQWKVSHLLKRACQYMMAKCYQNMEDPERARVMYSKAARKIPKRISPLSSLQKDENNEKESSGSSSSSKKKKKKSIEITKKDGKKEDKKGDEMKERVNDEVNDEVIEEYVPDDEGTSNDENDDDDDVELEVDTTKNMLDPVMAMEKSEIVSKFGSFWAAKRHYELATIMIKSSLHEVDEHRQDWWTLLATCLKRQGQNKEAVEAVERAQSLASASGQGWRTRSSPFDEQSLDHKLESWKKDAALYGNILGMSRPSSAAKSRTHSRPSTAGSVRGGIRSSSSSGGGGGGGGGGGMTSEMAEKMEQRIIEAISKRMQDTLNARMDQLQEAVSPQKKAAEDNVDKNDSKKMKKRPISAINKKRKKNTTSSSRPPSANSNKSNSSRPTSAAKSRPRTAESRKEVTTYIETRPSTTMSTTRSPLNSDGLMNTSGAPIPSSAWKGNDSSNDANIAHLAGAAAQATAAAAKSIFSSSSAWASRSQTRLARVAQLAARATSALAEALEVAHNEATSGSVDGSVDGSFDVGGRGGGDGVDGVMNGGVSSGGSFVDQPVTATGPQIMPHFTPTSSQVLETSSIEEVVEPPVESHVFPPVTLSGIRNNETLRKDKKPKWRDGRDMLLIEKCFIEVSDTNNTVNGKVCKKAFLDQLANDYKVQSFIHENPYNLIQPLLLRSMTFTPRENATTFEMAPSTTRNKDRIISWNDVLEHIEQLGGRSTNAKGATEDTGDSYDPRFAFDRRRERSQAEREQLEIDKERKRKEKEMYQLEMRKKVEQDEKDRRLQLLSRSSLDTMAADDIDGIDVIDDNNGGSVVEHLRGNNSILQQQQHPAAVSQFGTITSDSVFHNSVLSNDLDHELSWQYKGGDGRVFHSIETDEEQRKRYEKEEKEFRQQRAEVEADLSVARTALAVRNLEAAQHIETVGRELNRRMKNGKSKMHRLLNVRSDAAAEIAKISSDAERVREKVQAHIDSVDQMLRMRRDTKDQRRHDEASSIAKMTLRNRRKGPEENDEDDSSSEEDDANMQLIRRVRGTDGILRVPDNRKKKKRSKKKKIFVDSSDPEMRMLFADYEHGTKVRQKILQVRTVHKHITEEEAFLALVECGSDVDRAIGKLTDSRFFRDLRVVSELAKDSKPGAFAHATATAMNKGSEAHQRGEDLERKEGDSRSQSNEQDGNSTSKLVSTYDKWVEYREEREREETRKEKTGEPTRISIQQHQNHARRRNNGGNSVLSGQITSNVKELGQSLALSSPYMAAPFTRAKPSKLERRQMKLRKKGNMANSFPAHIEGALAADAKWKKRGGVRKRLHQNRGTRTKNIQKKSGTSNTLQGSGARAAAAVSIYIFFIL